MGLSKTIDRMTNSLNVVLRRKLVQYGEIKNLYRKRKLISSVKLTDEQKNSIQNLYMKAYGKRITFHWHRLYTSYTGTFCPDYFPEILFSSKLEPITNPYKAAEIFGDKSLLPLLFSGMDVHIPKTIVFCNKGLYFDGDFNPIDFSEAVLRIKNQMNVVIKKTINTNSGKDVKILLKTDNSDNSIEELLRSFGDCYVVQELIKQSSDLEKLNPSSVNTFRVMTYFCDGKVFVCPIALRMGRSNADKDNIHNGGIGIGVNSYGVLNRYAFSEYGERFPSHPDTGMIFEGYRIRKAGTNLIETAKKLHYRIPYLGILSWDLTIDSDYRITLIEMNTTGQAAWLCQMFSGEPLFGENTEKMLKQIR